MSFFPCWSWPQLDLTLMEFSSNGWSLWVFNQSSSTIFKWIIFYLTLNQNVHQWLLVLSIWCASPTCESEVLNPHSLFECDANLKICLDDCLASPLHWIADLIFWFLHRLCINPLTLQFKIQSNFCKLWWCLHILVKSFYQSSWICLVLFHHIDLIVSNEVWISLHG